MKALFAVALVCFIGAACGMHRNEADDIKWSQSFFGKPTILEPLTATGKRSGSVVVATDDGVLASVSAKGELRWRKVFKEKITFLSQQDSAMLVTTEDEQSTSASVWSASDGSLLWKDAIESSLAPVHGSCLSTSSKKHAACAVVSGRTVVIVRPRLDMQVSTSSFLPVDSKAVRLSLVDEQTVLVAATTQTGSLNLWVIDIESDGVELSASVSKVSIEKDSSCSKEDVAIDAFEMSDNGHVVGVSSAGSSIVSVVSSGSGNGWTAALTCVLVDGELTSMSVPMYSNGMVVVTDKSSTKVLHVSEKEYEEITSVSDVNALVATSPSGHFLAVVSKKGSDEETMVMNVQDRSVVRSVKAIATASERAEMVAVNDKAFVYVVTGDWDFIAYNMESTGEELWTRAEALAAVKATHFIDPIMKEAERHMEHAEISTIWTLLLGSSVEVESRDHFGFHQTIVALSENGLLFGLSTYTGQLKWRVNLLSRLPKLGDIRSTELYIVSQGSPHAAPEAVFVVSDEDGNSAFVRVELLSGEIASVEKKTGVKHVFPVEVDALTSMLVLIPSSAHGEVDVVPETNANRKRLQALAGRLHFAVADTTESTLSGYAVNRLEDSGFGEVRVSVEEVWKRRFPDGVMHIAEGNADSSHFTSKQQTVRRLSTKSLLFKYLSPSLLGVVTVGSAVDVNENGVGRVGKTNMFFIDSVTGRELYNTKHGHAHPLTSNSGTIPFLVRDNWAVLALWNDRDFRQELHVWSLFEDRSRQKLGSSAGVSAFLTANVPNVVSQVYSIPHKVITMAATRSLHGVAHTDLLLGTTHGDILAVDFRLVDPLRPVGESNPDLQKQGLMPYAHNITVSPMQYVTASTPVERLRSIDVAPTYLESSCHMVGTGLDIVYSLVSPSKRFDRLADSFPYSVLAMTMLALVGALLAVGVWFPRKELQKNWK